MGSDWRESTWGEEISLEYGKALREYHSAIGKYRVYGSNGPIGWTSQPLAPAPGVILGRKGAYRGVQYSRDPFFVIDTAYYVVPKTELDMRWIFYAIKHHKLGEIDDGSPIPSTTRSAVYVREMQVPPLPVQKAIAHILGTLDDKIELNREMNTTLEAMAKALFQSWFVDFDPVRAKLNGQQPAGMDAETAALFPDSFVDSELGAIPRGWKIFTLGDLCRRIAMGPFGSDIKTDNFQQSGVPIIRGCNLTDGFVEEKFVFLSEGKADELRNANAFPGDIVITHRGTLGQVGLIPHGCRFPRYVVSQSQMLLSTDLTKATPRFLFNFLCSDFGQHALLANTSQTGVPAISRPTTSLRAIRLIAPPMEVLRSYNQVTEWFYSQVNSIKNQSRTLATLRDTLLPKLLSGERDLRDWLGKHGPQAGED